MSYVFDKAQQQYFTSNKFPTLPAPGSTFTILVWMKRDTSDTSLNSFQTAYSIENPSNQAEIAIKSYSGSTTLAQKGSSRLVGNTAGYAESFTSPSDLSYTPERWIPAIFRSQSNGNATLFFETFANSQTKFVDSNVTLSLANSSIGYINDGGSSGSYFSGKIAQLAIWTSLLGDADVTALLGGANPISVSEAPLSYLEMNDSLVDMMGFYDVSDWTPSAAPPTVSADNPPVDPPLLGQWGYRNDTSSTFGSINDASFGDVAGDLGAAVEVALPSSTRGFAIEAAPVGFGEGYLKSVELGINGETLVVGQYGDEGGFSERSSRKGNK